MQQLIHVQERKVQQQCVGLPEVHHKGCEGLKNRAGVVTTRQWELSELGGETVEF